MNTPHATPKTSDSFRRSFGQSPVFACAICERRTRKTNQGNGHLCPQCDEWCMQENGIVDGHYAKDPEGLAHAEAHILKMKEKAAELGGCRERLGLHK